MATETVHIATRVEVDHKDALEDCAAETGLPFGTWMRTVLLAAAGISPLKDQLTKATRRAQAGRDR